MLSRTSFVKQSVMMQIPYFSQFATPELADTIASGTFDPLKDRKWKQSGAQSKEEYAKWCIHTCGMACLKMVLGYLNKENPPIVNLAKQCMQYGGYIARNNTIDGLYYEPFCRFVKDTFTMSASVAPFLTVRRILFETGRKNLIIASVHPNIRNINNKTPKENGGHLVVITGFNTKHKTICLHNPSGNFANSQQHYTISWVDFERFFAGRGIVISV
ncbi:C39 family peptidase [Candidatus Roizmanbacteria bacterium]|nr:C39 family peptidase [Candidatus Roizmanbacteria bacterium]